MGGVTTWTDGQVETLKYLWAGGDSATVIGNQMGITRNSVLGKVHRLGLEQRGNRNGSSYGPLSASVYRAREVKPRRKTEKPSPTSVVAVSARTGAFINTKKRDPIPEMTKNQLRAMLTQAVMNTAALERA